MDEKEGFLSRWSRRKRESVVPATEDSLARAPLPAAVPATATPPAKEPLPPIESLTAESDFLPFMQADVDPGLKRRALQALFQDPRFNTMDMLDTYVDDYSQPDPLPEGWLSQLRQADRLGHYRTPEELASEAAQQAPASDGKNTEEQAVEVSAPGGIPDTESAIGEASEMGESGARRPTPT